MRKFIKRYIAVFMAACVILGGWNVQEGTAQAATFSDINQDSVFLKQPGGSNLCTLVAATMMVRRGAMMNGNDNWASISTDMMRSAAWVEGIGLKWNFTCGSVTVAHDSFSGTAADLQTKLSEHPEGIVLYKQKSDQQHAILVTDYTDGVFTVQIHREQLPPAGFRFLRRALQSRHPIISGISAARLSI